MYITHTMEAPWLRKIANVLVRRTCLLFWVFLLSAIGISAIGVIVLFQRTAEKGQSSIFTEATPYGVLAAAQPI